MPKAETPPKAETQQRVPETTELHVPVTMNMDTAPAIPKEVAAQPIQDQEPKPFDPRADKMAEISANRAKAIDKELEQGRVLAAEALEGEETETAAAPAQAVSAADPAADAGAPAQTQTQQNQQTAPENATQSAQPETITLTVDGRQLQVTNEELVRLAQQGISANQRFQEAARMRATGLQPEQQFLHGQPQIQNFPQNTQPHAVAGPAAPQGQPQTQDLIDPTSARDLARRMNYGSEEEQVQAIRDLGNIVATKLQGRQSLPAEQLVNVATQNAMQNIRFENNMATIQQEFPEVFNDRGLSLLAADAVNQLRYKAEIMGQPKPEIALYREACANVRQRYVSAAQPAPQQNQTQAVPVVQNLNPPQSAQAAPMQERLERKRAAPKPPVAANGIAKDMTQQKAVSASAIVAGMRKSRGQSALN